MGDAQLVYRQETYREGRSRRQPPTQHQFTGSIHACFLLHLSKSLTHLRSVISIDNSDPYYDGKRIVQHLEDSMKSITSSEITERGFDGWQVFQPFIRTS